MNWHWLLIPSHLLFALAGALVYRKHRDRVEMLRAQGDLLVDAFRSKK